MDDDGLIAEIDDLDVAEVFANYPDHIRSRLLHLRQLILDTATATEGVEDVTEALRWGEPSFLTKNGTTVRINWKASKPDRYSIYFHCQSALSDVFRELYDAVLNIEGQREIYFGLDETIPETELSHCIQLALTYHLRKHLPMLGVESI